MEEYGDGLMVLELMEMVNGLWTARSISRKPEKFREEEDDEKEDE